MASSILLISLCLTGIYAVNPASFLQKREEVLVGPQLLALEAADGFEWPNDSCEMLDEINHMRRDPVGYADMYLVPMLDKFSPYNYNGKAMWVFNSGYGSMLSYEGAAAVQECIDALKDPDLPPMEPLKYSDELGSSS